MFVINPDQYSLPCYRIGPFRTQDLSFNHTLPESDLIDDYLEKRFGEDNFIYTYNGRQAIHLALGFYNLEKNDVVTILTTSNNFYISGCVTKEIEEYCKWSREMTPKTKLILVNHEFGYPYKGLKMLKEKFNLPIIEDCAHAFYSEDEDNSIGRVGDFVIYSFPKVFPMQIGGLLVSNLKSALNVNSELDEEQLRHIKNVCSAYVNRESEIIHARRSNYNYLKERFAELGFKERFHLAEGDVPGVFMFSTNGTGINLDRLKENFWGHGIQCSVFYGEEAFFIPCHQNLVIEDLWYFMKIMKTFLNK